MKFRDDIIIIFKLKLIIIIIDRMVKGKIVSNVRT